MAHLLGLQQVGALAGSRILLEDVTLGLEDGDRIGILGPNGAGKSTLAKIVAGKRKPEQGIVTVASDTTIAMLDQSDHLEGETVSEALYGNRPEHEWAADPQLRAIHQGLLFDIDPNSQVKTLSGGQRRRVALTRVLSQNSQVLILDEPTNHLDVKGINWLAKYLRQRFSDRRRGALVVVTHDRWFLDSVCGQIWEVVPGVDLPGGRPQIPGRVEVYEGSYAAFVLARAERARQAQVAAEKRNNLLRKELAWLRRGAPARTSKPRFRIEAAEALIADVPPPRNQVELVKMATARLGKEVFNLVDVSVKFPTSEGEKTVLKDVTWLLGPGQRYGIVGANGAGKTTLLRLLEGTLTPTTGRIKRGKTVELAVLSQTTHELDQVSHLRVVEAVHKVRHSLIIDGKEVSASQLVERMGFTKERAWTPVSQLSGGERRRVQLMRLLMTEPNVLLLDEPTNDLDTDTLAAMEDLLDSFPGTLVVVSHDRYLLERVTDVQLALLGDGSLRDLPGGIDQYLQLQSEFDQQQRNQSQEKSAAPSASDSKGGQSHAGDLPGTGSPARLTPAARRELKKQVERLERSLKKATALVGELSSQVAQASSDPNQVTQLAALAKQLQLAEDEKDALEEEWLQVATQLEEEQ